MDKYDIELMRIANETWEHNSYTMDDGNCMLEVAKAARAWKDPREFQNGERILYQSGEFHIDAFYIGKHPLGGDKANLVIYTSHKGFITVSPSLVCHTPVIIDGIDIEKLEGKPSVEFQNGDEIEYFDHNKRIWIKRFFVGTTPTRSHECVISNDYGEFWSCKLSKIRRPRKTITYTKKLQYTVN